MGNSLRPALERKLKRAIGGDVLFGRFDRGRYATDASIYQVMPAGVVVPRTRDEAVTAMAVAREEGVSVLARGGGTSQCGQTVNDALVIDTSKHLTRILDLDIPGRTCRVEPGLVLDDLNRQLKPHGLWFPVDVSTASRATIGGMAGNNSCGGRSLRYGTMRDNVRAMRAVLASGEALEFGPIAPAELDRNHPDPGRDLFRDLLALGRREADEVAARFPAVQRRVGGYNLDALAPGEGANMAHLLVGSEGTLAFSTEIELTLWPLIGRKVLGLCHFGSFYAAMEAAQHLVRLKPIAIELVDRTMIGLARDIPMFRPLVERIVRGDPDALLIVEFAEPDEEANRNKLADLADLMADLGFSWQADHPRWGGVVPAIEPGLQNEVAGFRAAGLNIMMSMKSAGKPVSFIEDCAVPLPHLAAYTEGLQRLFERHGTSGTFYAHASEGCLHVRPVLNLKLDKDVKAMRAIAEEAFGLVRAFKGSHSGEHGDGIVRSEFHEAMFGPRLVRAFEGVKDRFDPAGLLNPGRIVRPPRMDDRSLFRYPPDYGVDDRAMALDWSEFSGASGGFQGAVEMCNNNGACRSLAGGVMCPSYRVTRNERDTTRGRANSLRLAISGQLGPDALASDAMLDTLELCVSCKGCRRECPTGVDMARMKIEVLAARNARGGLPLGDRLVAFLPRYARAAAAASGLANWRNRSPVLRRLLERVAGISARRSLPAWRRDAFAPAHTAFGPIGGREIVLFADTFNRAFERENLDAAIAVLVAGGYRVHLPRPAAGRRPLCCGRTFLAAGLVDEAGRELDRVIDTLGPFAARGVPIVGLEPSCLLTLRDEIVALRPTEAARQIAAAARLLEEFLADEAEAGRLALPLNPIGARALLHGHCHQKAFGAMGATERVLRLIPNLAVETVDSSCCGMAGAFGYREATYDVSMAMGELSLLPAMRAASHDTILVADGTSCRHQIADGAGREARHVVRVLAQALEQSAFPAAVSETRVAV
jgi:FAD/FMN-containing dehydrogenase/Fe-S oxidoreductase